MIAPFYLLMIEQKDEAFVASLENTVSGLASDKVQKADLPFTSKGELPVSRESVFIFIVFPPSFSRLPTFQSIYRDCSHPKRYLSLTYFRYKPLDE